MPMPSSVNGGNWISGDIIGQNQTNLKTNLVVPSATYVPVIGTDTQAGQLWIDPTTGLVRIMNSANTHWDMTNTTYLIRGPNGFPVNTSGSPNPSNQTTISFTNTSPTRTFSIAPTGANFSVYVNGTEYTFTTAQTVQITNTEGLWYIYFNSSGVLTASQSLWSLENDAVVAYIYWDATNALCSYFADERHMMTMDWRTHYYLHQSIGTRYVSGLTISGYTLGLDTDAGVEIGLTSGTVFDEDLEFDIANGVSGTPASTPSFYNQPITKPATIPVFYQIGATGIWRKQTITNFYMIVDATNKVLYYNLNSAGTWSLADVTSGHYMSMWIFATNDIDNPIIAIMGQLDSSTLTNAVTNDVYSALSIASGLPFLEMKLLYQIILQTRTSFGGTNYAKVQQVNDYRTSNIGGTATAGTGYITSVGLGFSVSAGNLALNSALWSIDASGNLTLNGNCIVDNGGTPFTLQSSHLQNIGSGDSPTFTGLTVGSLVFPTSGNVITTLVTESGAGITLTATNPTGFGTGYYTPSISGNLVIGAYGVTFTAIADSSNSGKLFLSSTLANALKYYDNQGSPVLHQIATLGTASDPAQTFGANSTWNGAIIGPSYLGSGTPTSSNFLRGDGTWATSSSLITAVDTNAFTITGSTLGLNTSNWSIDGSGNLTVAGKIVFGSGYNGEMYAGDTNWGFRVYNSGGEYDTMMQFGPTYSGNPRRCGVFDPQNSRWLLWVDDNGNTNAYGNIKTGGTFVTSGGVSGTTTTITWYDVNYTVHSLTIIGGIITSAS